MSTDTPQPPDGRLNAPATARNRDPILAVLTRVLPAQGTILEVAAGTGEHAVYFAPRLAPRIWLPAEPDARLRTSIAAWARAYPSDNLRAPIALDAGAPRWPVEDEPPEPPISAIVCINMIHIAPWAACLGLMAGAGRILPAGGVLYLYGPFMKEGAHTAPSNAAFDDSLRARDPQWGLRDIADVAAEATAHGLALTETVAMPANNFSLIFTRSEQAPAAA